MLETVDLGRAPVVPDHTGWDLSLSCYMHTGDNAVDAVKGNLPWGVPVAMDIEAAGLGAAAFTIRCVTLAWDNSQGETETVLLDPRRADHVQALALATDMASQLVLHNASYDWPVLVGHGLVDSEHVEKVWDTVVAARLAYPDRAVSKGLAALAARPELLDMEDTPANMAMAFKSAGYATQADGWAGMDINQPVYRLGAMADTVVTLRLAGVLWEKVVEFLTSNPFGMSTTQVGRDQAVALMEREQVTNRVMLSRSAKGLKVDTEYLASYTAEHMESLEQASSLLVDAGLDPQAGNLGLKLVEYLQSQGQLPSDWPTTATGKLSAAKKDMARLEDHPLAVAHRRVSELGKVTGYLEKVDQYAQVTGRIHPQVAVLGASATGRMAYSQPELQQFPGPARGILVPDSGQDWVSIDWSSIEPVVVANCAGDTSFLSGFNDHGADLYAPIVEQADVDRKTAKVVLLAAMYGQGKALLAKTLDTTEDAAQDIQARVFRSMPETRKFLDSLRNWGERYGHTMTADGRLLPVPTDPQGRVMAYKATNYFTQGSAYSVLSHTINLLHKQGLSGHIQLAMHDELVVTADVADQVRAAMETPPDWLETFCGHHVVLRTDTNPLPGRWAYV